MSALNLMARTPVLTQVNIKHFISIAELMLPADNEKALSIYEWRLLGDRFKFNEKAELELLNKSKVKKASSAKPARLNAKQWLNLFKVKR